VVQRYEKNLNSQIVPEKKLQQFEFREFRKQSFFACGIEKHNDFFAVLFYGFDDSFTKFVVMNNFVFLKIACSNSC